METFGVVKISRIANSKSNLVLIVKLGIQNLTLRTNLFAIFAIREFFPVQNRNVMVIFSRKMVHMELFGVALNLETLAAIINKRL